MKSYLWQLAKAFGAEAVMAAAFGRQPIVFMYHRFSRAPEPRRISADEFDAQMRYLAKNCHVISWNELIAGLRNQVRWQRNTVVVTIDDGYADVYDIAFPILKKYGLPATVFASSGFVNEVFWHWSDKLQFIMNATTLPTLHLECEKGQLDLPLATMPSKWDAWNRLADVCYEAPAAVRAGLVQSIARTARVTIPERAPPDFRSVDWPQLREMIAGGLNVGGHTATHPRLPQLSDAELAAELSGSKQTLESELQTAVTSFAYPFGTPSDHDARVARAVQQAGFDSACVAYFDRSFYDDVYALRRFGAGDDSWDFIKTADGLKRARVIQKSMLAR